jgi:transcriptional regulator with XRE-family HTH domain
MILNLPLVWGIIKKKRLRLYELAEILDVSRGYLSQVLGGRKNPSREFAQKIAIALHVDLGVITSDQAASPGQASPENASRIRRKKSDRK